MRVLNKMILVLFIFLPNTVQSATLYYALNAEINPKKKSMIGTAFLETDSDKKISLFVRFLKNVKIDDSPVNVSDDDTINLTLKNHKQTQISYEVFFQNAGDNFIDSNNVFLNEHWYPQPDVLTEYTLSVTLPKNFMATSEAESVTILKHGKNKIFQFQFEHPLDALHLAASSQYVFQKKYYKNIAIETYFFKEDAPLADAYIAHSKRYLEMYEKMLTPYPYRRFAIIESILPTGNSMPTFTLLGRQVVRLPFIVKTSLGHEILHQWFGNSVYIDFSHGNWSEGLTNYLADHHYAALEGKGIAYRKQIMVDYNAYVNKNNAMSLRDFSSRHNKAQSAIGYGKSAMLFHGLKKRFGDNLFFAALRDFIRQNIFSEASWDNILYAFEKVTGEKLHEDMANLLDRKDIPQVNVTDSELRVDKGQIKLEFKLKQGGEPFRLRLPIAIYTENIKNHRHVDIQTAEETINLILDNLPSKVVIDESYALMRQLNPEEFPPVLASIMGKEKLTVAVSDEEKAKYQPLIDALGVRNITYIHPNDITFDHMKNNSILIAGSEHNLVTRLLGKQSKSEEGVYLKVFKNPYNKAERIMLVSAKDRSEVLAIEKKISHYGKYTELAFNSGKNTLKAISKNTVNALETIYPKLARSRVIYVGEQHNRFAHHMNQLQIIKKLNEQGIKIAVGMEMFQRPYQQAVDDYMSGQIDERTFLQRTKYFSKWRHDYNLYKPIIDYLKEQRIPLVALNIEGDISRRVAREGIHGLSDEEKKQLPSELAFFNEQYQRDLMKVYLQHPEQNGTKNFDYFLQAQILWDESMAESAQAYLVKNPDQKLVILAGNGHIRHRYGIPLRLYRRNQEPFTVIVQDDEIEKGIADYVLFTTELKGTVSPRLGILIEENEENLIIKGVSDKSPAKKGGLQKGDIVTQFAGQPIKSLCDLKYALFYSEFGSTVELHVIRDKETLIKEVELFRFHPHKN
ncbi:MAG: ChaN family lipoprotein [Deltaproteobacteria bacterium]|nr:ChaN family lipoprotein [Deltaproteobacteria bacterium]